MNISEIILAFEKGLISRTRAAEAVKSLLVKAGV